MGGSIRGVVGQIKWAYYNAAVLQGWTVTRSKENRWSVRATAIKLDAFQLTQRPLLLVVQHGKGEWLWPIEQLHTEGVGPVREIRATLGQPLPERKV